MGLMRVNIYKTTNPGLVGETSYICTHGLPAAPDVVRIRYIEAFATNHATRWHGMACPLDATNVSVINCGSTTSPNFEIVAMSLHSVIQ